MNDAERIRLAIECLLPVKITSYPNATTAIGALKLLEGMRIAVAPEKPFWDRGPGGLRSQE